MTMQVRSRRAGVRTPLALLTLLLATPALSRTLSRQSASRSEKRGTAPAYMYELYRELKAGDGGPVMYRSVLPTGGRGLSINFVHGVDNKSEISRQNSDTINSAELHIRTRKPKNFANRFSVSPNGSNVLDVSPEFRTFVGIGSDEISLPLHSSRLSGWKRFDVTPLLTKYSNKPWKLHLRFEDMSGIPISPRKLVRVNRTPFVLLRSDQSQDFEADFAPKSEMKIRQKRFIEISADIHPNDIESFDRHDELEEPKKKFGERKKKNMKKKYRYDVKSENDVLMKDDEVLDLYDDDLDDDLDGDVLDLDYEEDDLSVHEADQFRYKPGNSEFLPYPSNHGKGRNKKERKPSRKNKKGKKKKNKEENSVLPGIWKSLSHQSVSPTNHATLLSILAHSRPDVPAACCVPKKMDSLTLLYFDNDGSVVLKTYSQMSVQSCGCR